MLSLEYKTGDATNPDKVEGQVNILLHCVNDGNAGSGGTMGAGIAAGIRSKWPDVYLEYKKLFQYPASERKTAQGNIQFVPAEKDLIVCNLFGQSMTGDFYGLPAVRYEAVEEGLIRLKNALKNRKQKEKSVYIHMPRMCAGLAGGDFDRIEDMMKRVFKDTDFKITVYVLQSEQQFLKSNPEDNRVS